MRHSVPMVRKSAFAPVVNARTRVLILGSLPGEASLAAGQYYAHPRNQFWHLVGNVIGQDLARQSYPDRLDMLRGAGIGLWDTIAQARRDGSLDSAIRDAEHAPLAELVSGLPGLRAVAFNGRKAWTVGAPQLADCGVVPVALPSSSPAYAAMRKDEKEARWMVLRNYL